jgi:ubiquitin-conjugating enzyme E2 M
MLKLFSLKKEADASAGASASRTAKVSAAQLRAQKDHNELTLPPQCELSFKDPDDLLNFTLAITPDEGYWKGGRFFFTFVVGARMAVVLFPPPICRHTRLISLVHVL